LHREKIVKKRSFEGEGVILEAQIPAHSRLREESAETVVHVPLGECKHVFGD